MDNQQVYTGLPGSLTEQNSFFDHAVKYHHEAILNTVASINANLIVLMSSVISVTSPNLYNADGFYGWMAPVSTQDYLAQNFNYVIDGHFYGEPMNTQANPNGTFNLNLILSETGLHKGTNGAVSPSSVLIIGETGVRTAPHPKDSCHDGTCETPEEAAAFLNEIMDDLCGPSSTNGYAGYGYWQYQDMGSGGMSDQFFFVNDQLDDGGSFFDILDLPDCLGQDS